MSLKSIEMQIAIPRTGDAGIHQNQLLQKPIMDQASLAAATLKHQEEQRKRSNKVDETTNQLKTHQESSNKGQHGNAKKKDENRQKLETEAVDHPYKGHHIDLSL